jgi:hypothetical protein
MSKIPHKKEEPQGYFGITQPARIPRIAWIVFLIISASGNMPSAVSHGRGL